MTLQILEIPEDSAELPGWLERQLVGDELGALVAELAAVHDAKPDGTSLDDLFGTARGTVLAEGLSALSPDQVRRLLQYPTLLLELQELILVEGGPYWQQKLPQSLAEGQLIDSTWQRLQHTLQPPPAVSHKPPTAWYRRPWIVSLVTAAAVLLVVFGVQHFRQGVPEPTVAAWGWNRADALPEHLPADKYLNQLADGANAWFKKRPESREALAQRILQFRQGCSKLLLAEHEPLSPDDRQWLRDRCRSWATKIDAHLAAAESAADKQSVLKVRGEMDATVTKLVATLKQRSRTVSTPS